MSDYAIIGIEGISRAELLIKLEEAKAWGGTEQLVRITANGKTLYENINELALVIENDLAEYLDRKFGSKRMMLKSGGHDELFFVPNYEDEHFKKLRHKPTNFTPKKKKRKK